MCSAGLSSIREEAGGATPHILQRYGICERSKSKKSSSQDPTIADPSDESESQSSPGSAVMRDESSCGLCHKQFASRTKLYRHYSISHFRKGLKQFINVKEKTCTICEYGYQRLENLLCHVGATHDKVEQFLDPSLHVPKKQVFSNKKSSECNICHKKFSDSYPLKCHLALCHFKEEFRQFINEDQLQCNICHSTFYSIYNLRIHVGLAHKKVEEAMPELTKCPEQSLDQLDLDLELSSEEDQEELEISQGDVGDIEEEEVEEEEEGEEDYKQDDVPEKHSRKRLRVPGKGEKDGSQVKKSKKVFETVVKVQENVKLPNSTNVEGDGDEVSFRSQNRDEIDDLLSDSD